MEIIDDIEIIRKDDDSQQVNLGDKGKLGKSVHGENPIKASKTSSEETTSIKVDADLVNGLHTPADNPPWYKNKYTWIFIAIIIAAIALRGYYFWMTQSQPLWWDESQYMAVAKTYAGQGFEDLAGQRLPGFPLFMSVFFSAGIHNEALIRFFGLLAPSILMLIGLYLVVCKIYSDKRIALVSVAIMAMLSESLFYSNRFHTENFGLIFQCLSLLCMYAFINNKNKKNAFWLVLMGAMAALAVFFRPGQMLFVPAALIFLAITQWKEHKTAVIISAVILALAATGVMMFVPSLAYIIQSNMNTNNIGIQWSSLGVFDGLFYPLLNIFFYLGFAVALFKVFNFKKDETDLADTFNILTIVTVMLAFIFIIRAPAFEYRWFFPLIISALALTAKGIVGVADTIGSAMKGKAFSIIIILAILSFSLFYQVSNADMIIKNKLNSYADVKYAALWMKTTTAPGDIIFSISKPQTAYYSERKVMSYSLLNNSAQFDQFIIENRPRWITVSIYEPHPQWIYEWLDKNQQFIYPAAVWFINNDQRYPALIVYGLKSDIIFPEECNEDTCAA
jgi:hypothetical protein